MAYTWQLSFCQLIQHSLSEGGLIEGLVRNQNVTPPSPAVMESEKAS